MGSKNKLKRFKENEIFHNVIQPDRDELEKDLFYLKGVGINYILKMTSQLYWNLAVEKESIRFT